MPRLSLPLVALLLALPTGAALAAPEHNTLTDEERGDGWILLFDGHSLFGWKAATDANWKVADGVVTADQGEVGLLYTTSPFADYVLKVDFRAAEGTNSGVFLRTPPEPEEPAKDCYELNIADPGTNPFPTGSFVGREKVVLKGLSHDWHTYEVTARGGHFTVKLDGKQILDYTDPEPLGRGHIGLQLNEGKIEFRNVKLKPLELEPIFNGKDLSGWKVFPDKKSVWSVTEEGYLNVKNGNGQLESEGKWGDFVLQLDVKVNGKGLNSGIFFRSIPGEFWQGYESQIHNGYKGDDRTEPVDYGTGGIYRRQKARKVVADDFEWFTKTVVAAGPHIAVWVDGYQVSDWTDTRDPDPNPRRGLRNEPGTIIFQGHDPTTDLSFKEIQIKEMPKR